MRLLKNHIPFEKEFDTRKENFCNLYTSLILHQEIIGFSNLFDQFKKSKYHFKNDEFTYEAVNMCVTAIDQFYSHRHFRSQIENISKSIVETFLDEEFLFFREVFPDQNDFILNHRFTLHQVEEIKSILKRSFEPIEELLTDLEEIESDLNEALKELYTPSVLMNKSSSFATSNNFKKGNCVGPAIFASSGTVIGQYFSDGVYGTRAAKHHLRECMAHICDYSDKVDELHRLVISNCGTYYSIFEEVSNRFNQQEIELYKGLTDKGLSNVDAIFKEYLGLELKQMEMTFNTPVYEDNPNFTFNKMIESVFQTLTSSKIAA